MDTHPAIREVIELHDFFQAWLTAALPNDEATFARFAETTDPDFTLITPDGTVLDCAAVTGWIRSAHGSRPGSRLWTTDHAVRYADAGCVLVTYNEWQTRDGATTCRISSALFTAGDAAPNGLLWQHVHETWIVAG